MVACGISHPTVKHLDTYAFARIKLLRYARYPIMSLGVIILVQWNGGVSSPTPEEYPELDICVPPYTHKQDQAG